MSHDEVCSCGFVAVGSEVTSMRNWNPDCPVHADLHHSHMSRGYDSHCKRCKKEKKEGANP